MIRAPHAALGAVALAAIAVPILSGCASLPAARPAPSASASAPHGGAMPAPAPARVDSEPSADALAVLGTIPEPLSPSERVAPAPSETRIAEGAGVVAAAAILSGARENAAADSAAGDSAGAGGAAADSAKSGIPVPALTVPLGERPGSVAQALPESALVPTEKTAPAQPDTCWRLQVGAPPEKAKAESLQGVASSQLLTPFVIELEKQRYKVRTRECMSRSAVDALQSRAERSGFKGCFAVRVVAKEKKP